MAQLQGIQSPDLDFFSTKSEIEVLGHLIKFETSDQLHIAYHDSPKGFPTYDDGYGSCLIHELCIIYVNYAKKS